MDRPGNVTRKSAHYQRGKPLRALMITVISLLLAIGSTALFSQPQDTEAAGGLVLKAWSGRGITTGKFEKWFENSSFYNLNSQKIISVTATF